MVRSRRVFLAVDVAVLVWFVAMLVLGAVIRNEIRTLGATADSMTQVAQQEAALASALEPLRVIPVASQQIADAQRQLRDASSRTSHDAAVTDASVHDLADSAFLLVLLIAVFPIVAFYVPMRLVTRSRIATRREIA